MAHHLYHVLAGFFDRYGYWTVFLASLMENAGVPVPGESALLFASFLARRGQMRLIWAILAAIAGAILGEGAGFLIGRLGGRALVEHYRHKLLIPKSAFERSQSIFLKNATWAILVARFVSGLRETVGLLAGVFGMRPERFMFLNVLGAFIWAISTGWIAYFLASSWLRVFRFLTHINALGLAALVVLAVVLLVRIFRRRKPEPEEQLRPNRALEGRRQ